jgi:hypothetical protein
MARYESWKLKDLIIMGLKISCIISDAHSTATGRRFLPGSSLEISFIVMNRKALTTEGPLPVISVKNPAAAMVSADFTVIAAGLFPAHARLLCRIP